MEKFSLPGRKQTARNEDFIRLWDNIERVVSKDECEHMVYEAAMDIISKVDGKRAGYAWSGGKDSIALQVVCELAGVHLSVIGLSKEIEYPHYMRWIDNNKPTGCISWDAGIGYDWLIKHPHMVFPESSELMAKWYSLIQHKAQASFYQDAKLGVILLGRRTQDGNYTGGRGTNIYTDRKGVTRFSPIAHWRHEHVLAACHYFKSRNLPPIYNDPEGWIGGTGVWPVQTSIEGRNRSWEILYQISPPTLAKAANYFNEARQILEKYGKNSQTRR